MNDKQPRIVAQRVCLIVFTLLIVIGLMGGDEIYMSASAQVKNVGPAERRFIVKLPIKQGKDHWVFTDKDAVMSSEIRLTLVNKNRALDLPIISDGKIHTGWTFSDSPKSDDLNGIYFKFISSQKYMTYPDDRLEIVLRNSQEIPGIGPDSAGVLPVGNYISKGKYTSLTDKQDLTMLIKSMQKKSGGSLTEEQKNTVEKMRDLFDYKAYCESWDSQWSLIDVQEEGWLSRPDISPVGSKTPTASVAPINNDRGIIDDTQQNDSESEVSDQGSSREAEDHNSLRYFWIFVIVASIAYCVYLKRR